MKTVVYSYRDFDEKKWFDHYSKELGMELVICRDAPSFENAHLAEGCACMDILTSKMTRELIAKFHEMGVRYIATIMLIHRRRKSLGYRWQMRLTVRTVLLTIR